MKGIHPLVAAMLLIAITLAAISVVFQAGNPIVDRSKEILTFQEAKSNILSIDSSIDSVSFQGEGAARSLLLSSADGEYFIDSDLDEIVFTMDSPNQVYGAGVSNITDGLNITGSAGQVIMRISYDNVDISGGGRFGVGTWSILIKNDGYDDISEKQEISVTLS